MARKSGFVQSTGNFIKSCYNHELSYAITRPYFHDKRKNSCLKVIVLVVSLVCLAGFALFAFASSAYDLQPTSESNPNITEAERFWYLNDLFTFGNDELYPKCQHMQLNIGDTFLTNNSGFRYSLDGIYLAGPSKPSPNERPGPRSTVDYLNNPFTSCRVDRIQMDLHKLDSSVPPNTKWISWAGSSASADAYAKCEIENDEGRYSLNLSAHYNGRNALYGFIAINSIDSNAPLWWGARLMGLYFVSTQRILANTIFTDDTGLNYVDVNMKFFHDIAFAAPDVRGQGAFRPEYSFLRSNGVSRHERNEGVSFFNNDTHTLSRPLTEGLFFAKVFQSAVLADLGARAEDNVLVDEHALRYIINPNDDFNRVDDGPLNINDTDSDWWRVRALPRPPAESNSADVAVGTDIAFDEFGGFDADKFAVAPATVYTQYFCRVPKKRSNATAVLFAVVASLSLMQTF